MINRFLKAGRETSLFERHTCRLIIPSRGGDFSDSCRVWTCPDHTNWFFCPPNNTEENIVPITPLFHVKPARDVSMYFSRDLSAGTLNCSQKKKKRKTGMEERRHNVYCSHPFVIVTSQFESSMMLKCWLCFFVRWKERMVFKS